MSMKPDKCGLWRIYHARGNRPTWQWTSPGEPLNNVQPRVGTKHPAGSGGGKSRGLHGGNGGRERQERIADLAKEEQV